MSVIKITVNDQNLLITDAPKIAAQGVNENYIEFTFSGDWDGFGKTANFYRDTAPTVIYQSVVDQNGYAAIPHEITANESWICIGLSGVKNDVVKTSEILKYKIVNGLYVVESTDPTPDVYEQILALAGNIEALVTQIGTDTAASVAAIEASTASSIANIQETVDGIDDAVDQVDARMDTFIAGQTGTSNGTLITEMSLFTASSPAKTDITVSDDINNYDYIDIRYAVFGRTKISRFLPSDIAAGAHWNEFEHVNTIDIDTGATDPNARSVLRKVGFKLTRASETSLSFELEVWRWDGKSTTNGVNAETIGSSWNVGIYSITGVKYEAAGTSKDAELTDIRVGADGVTYATAGEAVRTQFTNADNDIQELKEDLNAVAENVKSRNLFNGHVTDGYITPNGTVYGGATYHYTDKIDTSDKHGKTLYFVNNGNTSATFRFLCAYGSDGKPIESAGLNSASSNYTVPSNVDSIVVSFSQAVTGVSIETDYPSNVYTGFYDYLQLKKYPPIDGAINIPMPMVKTADSLVDGELIGFGNIRNSVKRGNQTFEMYCKVPNGLPHNAYVILGKNSSAGYAFGVTDEKWNHFVNDVPVSDGYNHGLTIKDYLYIRITIKDEDGIAYINIRTNGGTYSRTNTSWGGVHGVPYCTNKGNVAITDVRFTWTCESFRHRIWIFGDSYTSVAQTRWPYYLYDLGLNKNVLINGYAGEASYDGYYDWKGCLPFGTPSIALWLYGMNNADNGAVNADWLTYTRLFLKDCEDRDITPILATIPCCPRADNSYKNAWVRASGYRYIEFADAVNVERDSTTWYDDMLSSDNIHPDVQGAIALASRVFVDVPELFIN